MGEDEKIAYGMYKNIPPHLTVLADKSGYSLTVNVHGNYQLYDGNTNDEMYLFHTKDEVAAFLKGTVAGKGKDVHN